jgi:hypothetical protein
MRPRLQLQRSFAGGPAPWLPYLALTRDGVSAILFVRLRVRGYAHALLDGTFSRQEFVSGFQRWFAAWDSRKSGNLDSNAVRDGMNKDLNPFAGGLPGPGGPGSQNFNLQGRDGRRNGLSATDGNNQITSEEFKRKPFAGIRNGVPAPVTH